MITSIEKLDKKYRDNATPVIAYSPYEFNHIYIANNTSRMTSQITTDFYNSEINVYELLGCHFFEGKIYDWFMTEKLILNEGTKKQQIYFIYEAKNKF